MSSQLFTIVDTETTGVDPANDALVDIAAVDAKLEAAGFLISEKPRMGLIKPPIPIPPAASAVHHIIDADVADAGSARDIVPLVLAPNRNQIYVAHNAKFEMGFLEPYVPGATWLCTYRAALRAFPDAPGHSNQALRYWLNLPVDRAIADNAHRAFPDADVTAHLLKVLLEKVALADMLVWTLEPPLLPTCPIGEYRGKPWPEVDYGFLSWMISKPVDDPDLVWNAKQEMQRRADAQRAERQQEKAAPAESPVDPFAEKRPAYVRLAIAAVKTSKTVDEIKDWLRFERANHFAENGIVEGGEAFNEIVAACTTQRLELEPQQQSHAA